MSVIIRLQNLPWSANAADIRAYFTGLSIPEGGVHIVGGEQGDAFIAFSTDEDARQAMLRDGGKLKEVKIKLFLSSRTEMLRIIEQARQQTLNLQNIIQGTVPQPAAPMVPQNVSTINYETGDSKDNSKEEDSDKGRDDDDYHRDRRDRRDRDRSGSRDRARSVDKDRSRDRDRERDRGGRYNRERDRDRRRRDRSKSRDRYRRRSRSRDRTRRNSREKDRGKRRDSEQEGDDKRGMGGDNSDQSSPQHWEPHIQPKPALLPDPVGPMMMQMPTNIKEMTPPQQPLMGFQDQDRRPLGFPPQMPPQMGYQGMPMRGREGWGGGPHMNNMSMPVMTSETNRMPMNRNPMMPGPTNDMPMPKYPQAPYGVMNQQFMHNKPDPNPHGNKHWVNQGMAQKNNDEKDNDVCIEIHGLPLNATYVDVKRLFDGLTIPSDGIKMINDNHGNRTGIAYVKFTQKAHKKLALNQNGKKVRSSIVEVLHLRESIYNTAVDNFKPEKDVTMKLDDMDIDNGDNNDEMPWKREGDGKKMGGFQDPRVLNKNTVHKNMGNKNNEMGRRDKIKLDCVLIKGLPHTSSERDLHDFFSEIGLTPMEIYIVVDNMGQRVGDAFCKFEKPEEAEKATSKNKANIGRHQVTVFAVPREDMERAKSFRMEPQPPMFGGGPPFMPMRGGMMQFNPRMPGDRMQNDYYMEGGGDNRRMGGYATRGGYMMGDGMERPMMGRERPMMGRGRGMMPPPHMGNMRPPRRPPTRATSPYIDGDSLENFGKPGCVVALENIHFKADIDEIMEFFQGFKIEHEDVIRRFDESGRPTGDARVALKTPAEAMRAVRQLSFKMIRGRSVKVSIVQQ